MLAELDCRFGNRQVPSIVAIEQTLLKAANGDDFHSEIAALQKSCYKNDIEWFDLSRHLLLLQDVVKRSNGTALKKVTSINTICDVMANNTVYPDMLPSVHNLLHLYMTIPITSSTSERTFSALRRVLTYLRSTMTEKRLNNYLLLHVHKTLSDNLDLTAVAKEFISRHDERLKYFRNFVAN